MNTAAPSASPARHFDGDRLVIASHNAGKVREIGDLLSPFGVECLSAGALGLAEPEETEISFVGNAELKARAAATAAQMPALADDSGLAVRALGGDPGIYSARWGGPDRDFGLAMQRIWEKMGNADDRSAAFICALSLAWPDGHCNSFEGQVSGQIVWPGRGDKGFGYDPIFMADGCDITFGEMEPAAKHAMSHRADAFRQLIAACFRA